MRNNLHVENPEEQDLTKENVKSYKGEDQPLFSELNDDDKQDLLKKIKDREKGLGDRKEKMLSTLKRNREYWKGNQIDEDELFEGEEAIVVNRIFTDIETIIPIVTRQVPPVNITCRPYRKNNRLLEDKLYRHLTDLWKIHTEMPHKLQRAARHALAAGFMVFKVFYDPSEDELCAEFKPTGTVIFPKTHDLQNAPFIIEYVTCDLSELITKFANGDQEIEEKIESEVKKLEGGEVNNSTQVTYIEYWESDFVAYKLGDLILGYDQNPNFNYEVEIETDDQTGETKDFNSPNLFNNPKYPYIEFSYLNWGEDVIDDTTLIDQTRSLQDNVNKRKRQIDRNVDLANGQIVIAGNYMTKEDASDIKNVTGEIIYLEKAEDARQGIVKLNSRAFDAGVYNDYTDSKSEIDNIMGTHSNLRGEREAKETATGRTLLKESSEGRLDLFTRNLATFAQKWYEYMIQLIYVYYTNEYSIHSLPDDVNESNLADLSDSEKQNFLTSEMLKDVSITVLVEKDSMTPKDDAVMQAQAFDLAREKMMSLLDFYRIAGYPNAEELARNAIMEQVDPVGFYSQLEGGEPYSFEAKKLIRGYVNGDFNMNNPAPPMPETATIEDLDKFVNTLRKYVMGDEIEEDFVEFQKLADETKIGILDQLKQNKDLLEQLIIEEKQMVDMEKQMMGPAAPGQILPMPPQAQEQEMPPEMMPPQGPEVPPPPM